MAKAQIRQLQKTLAYMPVLAAAAGAAFSYEMGNWIY
jgi:hypothetical protein